MNATRLKLKNVGTGMIKTYGKRNVRKVEIQPWFSPHSRDRIFSSTSSSEVSASHGSSEVSASHGDSCDSDFLPTKRARKKTVAFSRALKPSQNKRKTPVKKKQAKRAKFEHSRRVLRERNNNKENLQQGSRDTAAVWREKGHNDGPIARIEPPIFIPPTPLGKFITQRRKPQNHDPSPAPVVVSKRRLTRKSKKVLLSADILGSSSDFTVSPAHLIQFRKRSTACRSAHFTPNLHSQHASGNMRTRRRTYKCPPLCSTPSVTQKSGCVTQDPSMSEISSSEDLEDCVGRGKDNSDTINLRPRKQELLHQKQMSDKQQLYFEGCKVLLPYTSSKSTCLPDSRTLHLENNGSALSNIKTRRLSGSHSVTEIGTANEDRFPALPSLVQKKSKLTRLSHSSSRNDYETAPDRSASRELFSHASQLCVDSPDNVPKDKTSTVAVPATVPADEVMEDESSIQKREKKIEELKGLCTAVQSLVVLSPSTVQNFLKNKQTVVKNSFAEGELINLNEPSPSDGCLEGDHKLQDVLQHKCSELERRTAELKVLCTAVQPFVLLDILDLEEAKKISTRGSEGTPFAFQMHHKMNKTKERKLRRDTSKLCTVLFPTNGENTSQTEYCLAEDSEIRDCKVATQSRLQDEEREIFRNSMELHFPQPLVLLDPSEVQHNLQERETESKKATGTLAGCSYQWSGTKHAVSPVKREGFAKPKASSVLKDAAGTARKACISGFSSNRWGKRAKSKPFSKKGHLGRANKDADFSLADYRYKKEKKRKVMEAIPRNDGFKIMTPGTAQKVNLQGSFFSSPAPNSCSLDYSHLQASHGWSRLKATLSVHNKKKVVPTPVRSKRWDLQDVIRAGLCSPQPGTPGVVRAQDYAETPRSDMSTASHPHEMSFMGALTPMRSPSFVEDITDAEKVFRECQQDGPVTFEECIPPKKLQKCEKIGEGVFGEVFRTINDKNEHVALKIIPIEGQQTVNGESQKTFDSILPEIIISKELSCLSNETTNKTVGFVTLNSAHCVKGSYPAQLLKSWDKFDKDRGSENDRPDFFDEEQLFMVLEFEFGGTDLENMKRKLSSAAAVLSILHQVTASLAVAEEALKFEHRDLHWGNVLVKSTSLKEVKYTLYGTEHRISTHGVQTSIIDYTLSRLEKDGLTVFCDISTDEDLFKGEGDYQFEIYRQMREENLNSWMEYNPHSNVLWLHYLADKMLNAMTLKSKPRTAPMKAIWRKVKNFYNEVRTFSTATEVLQRSSLFQ